MIDETSLAGENYAVILSCEESDKFGHNSTFIREMDTEFAAAGMPLRPIDYRSEPRMLTSALMDPNCRFAICFNGFGSEVSVIGPRAGSLRAAYEVFRKPLFDLFHGNPLHETMAHQVGVKTGFRNILFTDYGHLAEGMELGFPRTYYVPSITFPSHLHEPRPRLRDRPIPILLPVGLTPPGQIAGRYDGRPSYRGAVYRAVYEAVVDVCLRDLRKDPRAEVRRACREAGLSFDVNTADSRFLLTMAIDMVKVARRSQLLEKLKSFPLAVLNNDPDGVTDTGHKTIGVAGFPGLLKVMAQSRIVLCPLPHMTGFHERVLGAFSAESVVLAAPNDLLGTHFEFGREFLEYGTTEELCDILSMLDKDEELAQEVATAGCRRAMEQFAPGRLTATILSLWRMTARR